MAATTRDAFQIWWKRNYLFYPKGSRIAAKDAWNAALASHAPSDKNTEGLIWAVERWNLEVRNRPIRNVHYRTLDETWRQVIRYFSGDPDELVGPPPQYSAPSEAAAQPTEGQRLFAAYKRDEIEHNDH